MDRFASMLSTQLPRLNAKWCDPNCAHIDCLHLPDTAWRRENNYRTPPWPSLPTLAALLRQFGAVTTVVAPYWQKTVVSRPPPARSPYSTFPSLARVILLRQALQARGGRTTQMEHRGLFVDTLLWLFTRRGAIPTQVPTRRPS
jgi:hypothetical protein